MKVCLVENSLNYQWKVKMVLQFFNTVEFSNGFSCHLSFRIRYQLWRHLFNEYSWNSNVHQMSLTFSNHWWLLLSSDGTSQRGCHMSALEGKNTVGFILFFNDWLDRIYHISKTLWWGVGGRWGGGLTFNHMTFWCRQMVTQINILYHP